MRERSDRIPLAPHESRCEPSRGCTMVARCMRALASIPKGTPLGDPTVMNGPGTALCEGYMPIDMARHVAPERKPAKPWPAHE